MEFYLVVWLFNYKLDFILISLFFGHWLDLLTLFYGLWISYIVNLKHVCIALLHFNVFFIVMIVELQLVCIVLVQFTVTLLLPCNYFKTSAVTVGFDSALCVSKCNVVLFHLPFPKSIVSVIFKAVNWISKSTRSIGTATIPPPGWLCMGAEVCAMTLAVKDVPK